MRKLTLAVVGLIVIVVAVVLVRATMLASSRQPPPGPTLPVDSAAAFKVAVHLAEAIRFQTISVSDTARPDAALDAMRAWMEKTYPRVHAALSREIIEKSLLYTW